MNQRSAFSATVLLTLAMLHVKTFETRRIVPVALVFLSVSLAVMLVPPTSAYEEPVKAPDLTDYVSMYKDTHKNILDNEKFIKEYKKELDDKSKMPDEISAIKKKISAQKLENQGLWENLNEIERLNIESYKLDKKTQKLFDEAEDVIKNHFLDINGVYDVFTEKKYRKVIVSVDSDDFANSDYPHGIEAFIDEIQKSVDVDVEVHVAKLIQIHSTGCSSATSPCQPAKGGVQISHQNTAGGGSTLGFKAVHPIHGAGFIIAGHEARSVNTNIAQPKNGGIIGTVKVMGGSQCDCAFVKSINGHTLNNEIWAPDAGTVYPVGIRNTAPTPVGTLLVFDGATSLLKYGSVVYETGDMGKIAIGASSGDSGSAAIQPQTNGKANIHGIVVRTDGQYTFYEPYDQIKLKLGLVW